MRLDAQAGAFRQREETRLAAHRGCHILQVTVEHRMLVLVHRAVRQGRRGMQAGGLEDADADAGMRDHLDVKGIGHAADLHELADAGVPHLGLDDRHAAPLQARPHLEYGTPLFAQRQRHLDGRTDLRLAFDVFRLAGSLDKIRLVGGELVDQLDRLLRGELPVQVDHEFDVRAQTLAQHPHLAHDALLRHRCSVLERIKSTRTEFAGQFQPLVERGARQARHIDRDLRHALPAQQFDDRLANQLAEQVPHRDVHAGNGVDVIATEKATHPHQVIQVLLDYHGVARVAPHDDRPQHVVDDAGDGVRGDDAVGFAPAHRAIVGSDLYQHRHVAAGVDRAVALANQVTARVDRFTGPERPEVRGIARNRDDE